MAEGGIIHVSLLSRPSRAAIPNWLVPHPGRLYEHLIPTTLLTKSLIKPDHEPNTQHSGCLGDSIIYSESQGIAEMRCRLLRPLWPLEGIN